MNELIYSSATSLAQSIRDKKVSSAEVVDAYIKRIEEINPNGTIAYRRSCVCEHPVGEAVAPAPTGFSYGPKVPANEDRYNKSGCSNLGAPT